MRVFFICLLFLAMCNLNSLHSEKYSVSIEKSVSTEKEKLSVLTKLYEYNLQHKNWQKSKDYLDRLIPIFKKNNDYNSLVYYYCQLADLMQREKNYFSALNQYSSALQYTEKRNHKEIGFIQANMANILIILNRFELAKQYLILAQKRANYTNDIKLQLKVKDAYSRMFFKEKKWKKALAFINSTITLCHQNDIHSLIYLYYLKAVVLRKMGIKNLADLFLQMAVNIGQKLHVDEEGFLPIWSEWIEHLIKRGLYKLAVVQLQKIDDIYAVYHPYYFYYNYLQGLLAEKQGYKKEASHFYGQTISLITRLYPDLNDYYYDTFKEKIGIIYDHLILFLLNQYETAANIEYLNKALFLHEFRNGFVFTHEQSEKPEVRSLVQEISKAKERYKNILHDLPKDDGNPENGEEKNLFQRFNSCQMAYWEWQDLLADMSYRFCNLKSDDFRIQDLQKKIKANHLIVKFMVIGNRIFIFYLNNRSYGLSRLSVDYQKLKEKIGILTAPLDEFTKGKVDYLRVHYDLETAYFLFKTLFEDILAQEKGNADLIVILDKELCKIPVESLVIDFNQGSFNTEVVFSEYSLATYVVEKYCIHYAFSLYHLLHRFEKKYSEKKFFMAAFGNPLIESNDNMVWAGRKKRIMPLPSTDIEIKAINKIFSNKHNWIGVGKDFSADNFFKYAPQASIIHIATHFFNNTEYPYLASFLCSVPDKSEPYIYASQIFPARLNADLVVLSACESAEKNLQGLQGLKGMSAAFRVAGVHSLMVSMWPVDEYNSQIVPLFYEEYQKGLPVSQALHQAKKKLLKRISPLENNISMSFSHPYLWANFILYDLYL